LWHFGALKRLQTQIRASIASFAKNKQLIAFFSHFGAVITFLAQFALLSFLLPQKKHYNAQFFLHKNSCKNMRKKSRRAQIFGQKSQKKSAQNFIPTVPRCSLS